MRLIDADRLSREMYHEAFETDTDLQKWDSGCWIRYKMFENKLDSAPTVEVKPQMNGDWEVFETESNSYRCSLCGEAFTLLEGSPSENGYEYCPHCGAKLSDHTAEQAEYDQFADMVGNSRWK